jgi:hypothetical protein
MVDRGVTPIARRQRAKPQPKGTAEDAEIRVICVICGLLGCPQITQKTQRSADYET